MEAALRGAGGQGRPTPRGYHLANRPSPLTPGTGASVVAPGPPSDPLQQLPRHSLVGAAWRPAFISNSGGSHSPEFLA